MMQRSTWCRIFCFPEEVSEWKSNRKFVKLSKHFVYFSIFFVSVILFEHFFSTWCNNISWQGGRNLSSSLRNSAAAVHGSLVFSFQHSGILFPKLFWPTVRKKCFVIEKNFWNSKLKVFLNSERFLKQNAFLTCSWRFLKHKLGKISVIQKPTGKVRKGPFFNAMPFSTASS